MPVVGTPLKSGHQRIRDSNEISESQKVDGLELIFSLVWSGELIRVLTGEEIMMPLPDPKSSVHLGAVVFASRGKEMNIWIGIFQL